MKVDLIAFQERAVKNLRMKIAEALGSYDRTHVPQVVSLQAPTGAGKTIMVAALIESIYSGSITSEGTTYIEQPEAIFVWLSDSPELNEQSKMKIELKTSKLRFGQCITITDESFDQECLDDGHIYFLNTQKISKSSNLTQHSDRRRYTIWETLNNTINRKSDRLYFIIDEAHRGAKSKREAGKDTTIMQRFIKGYEFYENNIKFRMEPMPVVLGMSATAERFNTLIGDTNSTLQKCIIRADEVKSSGLLKDRIVITYPDDPTKNNDFVLLEAATDEWAKKCKRWKQYTTEQHYANVDPVFVIQVCPGTSGDISDTDLDDVLSKIEERLNYKFKNGEVVHCFGNNVSLSINGLTVNHVNASDIADDHRIKIVFFKEALSTGWDCPRAETMMSYRTAQDPTYIAQLLGRMVRTPLQCRVQRDEFLNDVKLYLPHFDKDNVKKVVDELQSTEGGEIPTEINGESLEEPTYITWTVHTPKRNRVEKDNPDQLSLFDESQGNQNNDNFDDAINTHDAPEYLPPKTIVAPNNVNNESKDEPEPQEEEHFEQLTLTNELDREEIVKFVNSQGYLSYLVRQDRINDYLKSLLDLATLLTHNGIHFGAIEEVKNDVILLMRQYIEELHAKNLYDDLAKQVLQFKLLVQIFDSFGQEIQDNYGGLLLESETDLDRQLRNADSKLGRYGFTNLYGSKYYNPDNPNEYKIDCILFAADSDCRSKLGEYAKKKLHEFVNNYRIKIVNKSESCKKKYHDILADSDTVSEQIFSLPENIAVREDPDGHEYYDHLLVSETTGYAKIKLNGWESALIEEESKRDDFACWLRNPSRVSWALCIPYVMNNQTKPFYPDFIVIRCCDGVKYIADILEPHSDSYADNLPKAKALVKYARSEDRMGRIQLIHMDIDGAGNKKFKRLDLTDLEVQEKVIHANNDDELKNIFATNGFFD